jgi:threonine aldolase
MEQLSRRNFFKASVATSALGTTLLSSPKHLWASQNSESSAQVHFLMDGLYLTPSERIHLLDKLAGAGKIARDSYLSGGSTAQLEARFAQELGKEKAVFIPTGTLANHLALRNLAHGKRRVIVQAESHIYCDSLDCVQALSGCNLIPLALGRATIPLTEIEETCQRSLNGPFPAPVGAISIECPVRRKDGDVFDFQEMKRIAEFAKKNGIKMHLDGARLFIASAYTGIAPAEYAALFDTVYISLYKYFNAGTGAILAGSRDLIEQVTHDRKLFGSGLEQGWLYTAVALHYLDGFQERYKKAVATAQEFFALLEKDSRCKVEKNTHGTNIYRLRISGIDPAKYQQNLAKEGIRVSRERPPFPGVRLIINESINRTTAPLLAKTFIECLGTS